MIDLVEEARKLLADAVPMIVSYRGYPLGFRSSDSVGPGESTVVSTRQELGWFLGHRLLIPSELAASFAINDIRIAGRTQFTAPGSVEARAFAENMSGVRMELDPLPAHAAFELEITNISDVAAIFRATLLGINVPTLEKAESIASSAAQELQSAEALEEDAHVCCAERRRVLMDATRVVDAIRAAAARRLATN